jgi:hypothetical protein
VLGDFDCYKKSLQPGDSLSHGAPGPLMKPPTGSGTALSVPFTSILDNPFKMGIRRGIRLGLGLRRGQAKIDDKTISRSP